MVAAKAYQNLHHYSNEQMTPSLNSFFLPTPIASNPNDLKFEANFDLGVISILAKQ